MNRIAIYALLLTGLASAARAQIDADFQEGLPADARYSQGVELTAQYPVGGDNQAVELFGDGSYLAFERVHNPDQITFRYLSPKAGDNYRLVVQYRSGGAMDWLDFDNGEIRQIDQTNATQPIFVPYRITVRQRGDFDIRFLVREMDGGGGSAVIDDVSVTPLSADEVRRIEDEIRAEELRQDLQASLSREMSYQSFRTNVRSVKNDYIDQIQLLKDLTYRAKVIYTLSDVVNFMFLRTKMSDPTRYTTFQNIINDVKENGEELDKLLIDDLVEQIDLDRGAEFLQAQTARKSRGLAKALDVAYNVGNILTGGQLKGIFNSAKSIVANVFSRNTLERRFPRYVPDGSGGRFKMVLNPEHKQVEVLQQRGIEDFKRLDAFFGVIEDENVRLATIIVEFAKVAEEANDFAAKMEEFSLQYLQQGGANVDGAFVDDVLMRISDDYTRLAMKKAQDDIAAQFDDLVPADQESFKNQEIVLRARLKAMNRNIEQLLAYRNEYVRISDDLLNLFEQFEKDFERPNPFEGMEGFEVAQQEYEREKQQAQDKLTQILESLRDLFPEKR